MRLRYVVGEGTTDLKDSPGYSTHCFSESKDRERWSKEGDEDGDCHPDHEKHHCDTIAKSILRPEVDDKPSQLTDYGRIGETSLPRGSDSLRSR